MSSLASFSNLHCVTCDETTLHNGVGCVHCLTRRPAPIARDIGALTYSGQTAAVIAARLRRTGNLSRARALPKPRTGPYGERPRTIARDTQIIQHIARGLTTNAAISRELGGITPQGVGGAIRRTYLRLAVPLPNGNDHSVLIATARLRGVIA